MKEALASPDKDSWKKAMDEEIESLLVNETWDIVQLPEGCEDIGCKWVFKIKINADDQIDRYKARLVAKGYSQKYGSDYDEVFAPVVRQATFKCLLALAGRLGSSCLYETATRIYRSF